MYWIVFLKISALAPDISSQLCKADIDAMDAFAIVRSTVDILNFDLELDVLKDEERKAYYEAFQAFDWNNNGKIS